MLLKQSRSGTVPELPQEIVDIVQGMCVSLDDIHDLLIPGLPVLLLPIDHRRCNAQPSGNIRRARIRLIQCGKLSPV